MRYPTCMMYQWCIRACEPSLVLELFVGGQFSLVYFLGKDSFLGKYFFKPAPLCCFWLSLRLSLSLYFHSFLSHFTTYFSPKEIGSSQKHLYSFSYFLKHFGN